MEEWPTVGMDNLQAMMVMRQQINPTVSMNGFDPYQTILSRKKREEDPQSFPTIEYDPNDVRELEEFCKQYNIFGFNCGRMGPKAALNMLKNKLGILTEKTENKKILLG